MGLLMAVELLLLAVMMVLPGASAQGECLSTLLPCAQELGKSNPSEACCSPLKDAVSKNLSCLCALLGNKDLINQFKFNVTQAIELSKHCGITTSTSICNTTKTGAESPSNPPPPATGGASTLARRTVPALIGPLLLVWAGSMA